MNRSYRMSFLNAILGLWLCCPGSQHAFAGQYAKISDDLQLYYEDNGKGNPIVLIPGWTASEVVFEHQIDHFAKTHRVVAFDPRSQGLSTRTLENNTYDQHGRDLAGLIDKLGLKHVTLIGWSSGCLDLYAYVRAKGADNLAAVVCIDSPPQGFSAKPGDWAMLEASEKGIVEEREWRGMLLSDRRGFFESLFKSINARDVTPLEADWFLRQSMLTPSFAMLALETDSTFSDYRPEAKALDGKLPVLFAISEDSAAAALPWIKENMPHAGSFRIKRHMSFWSEPDSFNAALDAFLATTN